MTSLEIRPYAESDEATVAAFWREVFPKASAWNHPETDIQRKLAVQRELFLLAVLDAEIVATKRELLVGRFSPGAESRPCRTPYPSPAGGGATVRPGPAGF